MSPTLSFNEAFFPNGKRKTTLGVSFGVPADLQARLDVEGQERKAALLKESGSD